MVTSKLVTGVGDRILSSEMTYERLLQKVAANLFDVPVFRRSQSSKDFLLLNPTLLLHLLLPMQRNYLAYLVACRSIEFSRMLLSNFEKTVLGWVRVPKFWVRFQKIWIYLPLDLQAFLSVDWTPNYLNNCKEFPSFWLVDMSRPMKSHSW